MAERTLNNDAGRQNSVSSNRLVSKFRAETGRLVCFNSSRLEITIIVNKTLQDSDKCLFANIILNLHLLRPHIWTLASICILKTQNRLRNVPAMCS